METPSNGLAANLLTPSPYYPRIRLATTISEFATGKRSRLLSLLGSVAKVRHEDEVLVHALQETVPVRLGVDDRRLVVGLLAADHAAGADDGRVLVLLVPAAAGRAVQNAEKIDICRAGVGFVVSLSAC